MLVPEAQQQPAHLQSAPPSCETAGSKLPASAFNTPSYPKRGWGFSPPFPFCSLLPSFPAPAGLQGAAEGGGTVPGPGRGSPAPPGRRRGSAGAEGWPHRNRSGVSGVQWGALGAGQGGGETLPTGPRGTALEGAAHGRGEEGAGGWSRSCVAVRHAFPTLVRTAPSRVPHQ